MDTKQAYKQLSSRRAMLSALGIDLWTTKSTSVQTLPQWHSRLSNLSSQTSQTQKSSKQHHTNQLLITSSVSDGVLPAHKHTTPKNQANLTPKLLGLIDTKKHPPKNTKPSTDILTSDLVFVPKKMPETLSEAFGQNIPFCLPNDLLAVRLHVPSFALCGVRFGDWLLLADVSQMDSNTLGVWQALNNALQKEAKMTGVSFVSLQARYPLCDEGYAKFANFHQGLVSLLGFLTHLYAEGVAKVGLLTALMGIALGENLSAKQQTVPSLAQMGYNKHAKKQLWQLLTQS